MRLDIRVRDADAGPENETRARMSGKKPDGNIGEGSAWPIDPSTYGRSRGKVQDIPRKKKM